MTLTEVVVSAVLLSIVLTGLAALFVTGRRSMLHSRSRMITGELAKFFLEPLQMDVNQANWGSNCLSAQIGCPGAVTLSDGITYTPTYHTADIGGWLTDSRLRKARVTITWTENPPDG